MYITNFDAFSATLNLMIQMTHKNAISNPNLGTYQAEFYIWASWQAQAYSYAPNPTTL